jgi:hypothetical protein
MIVREGRLVQITNESQAYHQSFAQMHDLVKRLTGLGVDLTGDGGGVVVIVYAAIETRMGLAKGKRATE